MERILGFRLKLRSDKDVDLLFDWLKEDDQKKNLQTLPYKPMLAITASNSRDVDVTKSKDFVKNLRKKELEWKKKVAAKQDKRYASSV